MSKHVSLLPSRSVARAGVNAAGLLLRTPNSVVKRSINQSAKNLNSLPVPVEFVSSAAFPFGYYIPAAGGLCFVGGVAYWVYQMWTTPVVLDATNIVQVVSNKEYLKSQIPLELTHQ